MKLPSWMLGKGSKAPSAPAESAAANPSPAAPTASTSLRRSLYQAPVHPVSTAEVLLGQLHNWQECRDMLFRFSQVPDDIFESTYLAAVRAFAERVQWLPASPSYHHYEPLGQLEHTIDTVINVLTERRALILPLGAEPERESRERTVWTYAAFCAALCHDAGRPAAGFRIRAKVKDKWRPYSPLGASLVEIGATEYEARWDDRMPYHFHVHLAPFMFALLIPSTGRAWLNSSPEALGQLAAYLGGHKHHVGVLGEIAHKADARSVARYQHVRGPGASALGGKVPVPLHERAVSALRGLSSNWTINHRTREGTPKGVSDAWVQGNYIFVRSTVMDDMHSKLMSEDPKGIPAGSDIVTRLQDVGYCLSTPAANDGQAKAIFAVRLTDHAGKVIADKFTTLIFPLDVLFEVGHLPGQWNGTIAILSPRLPMNHVLMMEASSRSAAPGPSSPAPSPAEPSVGTADQPSPAEPAPAAAPTPPTSSVVATASAPSKPDAPVLQQQKQNVDVDPGVAAAAALDLLFGKPPGSDSTREEPTNAEHPAPANTQDETFSPAPTVATVLSKTEPAVVQSAPAPMPIPPVPMRTVDATNLDRLNEDGDFIPTAHRESDPPAVRAFFAWLKAGMLPDAEGKRRVSFNNKHAIVHGVAAVPNGLGIMSPRAFEQFEQTSGYVYTEEDAALARKPNLEGRPAKAEHLSFQLVFRKSRYAVYNGSKADQNVFSYSPPAKEGKPTRTISLAIVANGAVDLILPSDIPWIPNPVLTRLPSRAEPPLGTGAQLMTTSGPSPQSEKQSSATPPKREAKERRAEPKKSVANGPAAMPWDE